MIIASIAMEELALSHIHNAEDEKLRYILGTLPGTSPCARPQDVLTAGKSVTALVEAVTRNQMLLKNKLSQVLEFCPLPPPHPAPHRERTCEGSALQLVGRRMRDMPVPGAGRQKRLMRGGCCHGYCRAATSGPVDQRSPKEVLPL